MKFQKRLMFNREEGFIVQILFIVFYIAERISIFYWFRKLLNTIWIRKHKNQILNDQDGSICKNIKVSIGKSYILPEIWAVGSMLFALLCFYGITHGIIHSKVVIWSILILSFLRVWELFVYQINVLFFHRLNDTYLIPKTNKYDEIWKKYNQLHNHQKVEGYAIKSSTRTVILLLINMAEYIFQFSVMYVSIAFLFQGTVGIESILASFEIFMNLSNIGDVLNGASKILIRIGEIETILGIFMNIICLSRFIGMLPEVNQINKK